MTTRVSRFNRSSSSRATIWPMPPSRTCCPGVGSSRVTRPPPGSSAPSATTTSEKRLPWVSRSRIFWHTFSQVHGISGMRMTEAAPAMPACSAIHPV